MASGSLLIAAALVAPAAVVSPYVVERMRPKRPTERSAHYIGEPGYRTRYRWLGSENGPVAVCVHGLTTPSFVWDAFAQVLAHHGYRVLLYDLYGRGLSDTPAGLQSGSFFAKQLDDLLDQVDVAGPVFLLGYSMGGAIATYYAAHRQHRVAKLCLIAPAGLGHDLGPVPKLATHFPLVGDSLMRLAYPLSARRDLQAERDLDCAVHNMIQRQIDETRWRGFAPVVWSSIRGILSEDLQKCHHQIARHDIPTLAIWGADDQVIPISGAERLKTWNPRAESVIVPNAGHSLPYTHVSELESASKVMLS